MGIAVLIEGCRIGSADVATVEPDRSGQKFAVPSDPAIKPPKSCKLFSDLVSTAQTLCRCRTDMARPACEQPKLQEITLIFGVVTCFSWCLYLGIHIFQLHDKCGIHNLKRPNSKTRLAFCMYDHSIAASTCLHSAFLRWPEPALVKCSVGEVCSVAGMATLAALWRPRDLHPVLSMQNAFALCTLLFEVLEVAIRIVVPFWAAHLEK